jgi:hypothetical protein
MERKKSLKIIAWIVAKQIIMQRNALNYIDFEEVSWAQQIIVTMGRNHE